MDSQKSPKLQSQAFTVDETYEVGTSSQRDRMFAQAPSSAESAHAGHPRSSDGMQIRDLRTGEYQREKIKAHDPELEPLLSEWERQMEQERDVALTRQRAQLQADAVRSQSIALAQQRKLLEEWAAQDKAFALAELRSELEAKQVEFVGKRKSEDLLDSPRQARRRSVLSSSEHATPESVDTAPGDVFDTPSSSLLEVSPAIDSASRVISRRSSRALSRENVFQQMEELHIEHQESLLMEDMKGFLELLRAFQLEDDKERIQLEKQQDEYIVQIHQYQGRLEHAEKQLVVAQARAHRKADQLRATETELDAYHDELIASKARFEHLEKQLSTQRDQV
ncbi:hypothetical protein CYMTET_22296 [Cymbomonas tetramitiformis]|uniref:Uncharacterized protein n=1 Tax=Cymbomonas tetramitiformis TaxID=36881 RepID=A0AAE0L2F2_9CHLO|nr:hypothetical protein CYMTET_22296 [Cymbomonas tetramitiformis]